MKQFSNLQAELIEAAYVEPRGFVQALHVEPVTGAHVKVLLGAAGLVIKRGDAVVALPLPEILKLAIAHVPDLVAITSPDSGAAEVNLLARRIMAGNKIAEQTTTPPAAV